MDEIEYNVFYSILQNNFHRKFELARSKCWMICIPTAKALRGIKITKEFIDIHVLRQSPHKEGIFISTDSQSDYTYQCNGNVMVLLDAPFSLSKKYAVNILAMEEGYNKELQTYKILLIDKVLSPEFEAESSDAGNSILFSKEITSLKEANDFLNHFVEHKTILPLIDLELSQKQNCFSSSSLRQSMNRYWGNILSKHPPERQRDGRFQQLLSASVENYMMNKLHDQVFPWVCKKFSSEDLSISLKVRDLAVLGLTADQLGMSEDFAIQLPAAVVELASLDNLRCPIDKLMCLRTTLDLIIAQIKGAFVEANPFLYRDYLASNLTMDQLIPVLVTVLIQSKPLHMTGNLFYIEQYQWSMSPCDANNFTLLTFRAALNMLMGLDHTNLKPRSEKVHKELSLEKLMEVTGSICEKYQSTDEVFSSPLERQLEHVSEMLEASSQDLSLQLEMNERHGMNNEMPSCISISSFQNSED